GIALPAGKGLGVAVADYNRDGWSDIYVANDSVASFLFENNGDGTFTEVGLLAGVALTSDGKPFAGMGVDFQDYDNDGWPDLGIALPAGKGLGVAVADYNRDGWSDIYVANDSVARFLFENNGDGTFTEVGLLAGVALTSDGKPFAGMGVDFQDYDNDGWPDLVVTALSDEMYMLYRNNGDGTFTDRSLDSGLDSTILLAGWGVRFFAFDNDGLKDIFMANGHVMDTVEMYYGHIQYKQPLLLFRNRGRNKFDDVSKVAGPPFQRRYASRGLAVGDLDNDGVLDLVVSNLNDFP